MGRQQPSALRRSADPVHMWSNLSGCRGYPSGVPFTGPLSEGAVPSLPRKWNRCERLEVWYYTLEPTLKSWRQSVLGKAHLGRCQTGDGTCEDIDNPHVIKIDVILGLFMR